MTRVFHEDLDLLTPKELRAQICWANSVWPFNYGAIKNGGYCRTFLDFLWLTFSKKVLKGDLLIFSTKNVKTPRTTLLMVKIKTIRTCGSVKTKCSFEVFLFRSEHISQHLKPLFRHDLFLWYNCNLRVHRVLVKMPSATWLWTF